MSKDVLAQQERAYAIWAKFYDAVYRRLLAPFQRRTALNAARVGPRILEIGAGTGLVLRYYPAGTEVIATDLSVAMLKKASDKVAEEGLSQVAGIVAMDACRLAFLDATFDAVTVPFVITLVPDPEGALDEIARVLKPGGEIIIASRFGAETGFQASVEAALGPAMKKIGWSSDFRLSRVTKWAEKRGDLSLVDVWSPFFFKVVRFAKH